MAIKKNVFINKSAELTAQETGNGRQDMRGRRQEMGDGRQEVGDSRQNT